MEKKESYKEMYAEESISKVEKTFSKDLNLLSYNLMN